MNASVEKNALILDPRRLPRMPVRCRVDVLSGPRRWRAETLDVGPGGCQLVSPAAIATGAHIGLVVPPTPVCTALSLMGRVAWASGLPPLRLGVAFLPTMVRAASWFEQLVKARPGLARSLERGPDRIPANAVLYRGSPPRDIVDFTNSELLVLRHIGDGVTAEQLRERTASTWTASRAALFGLLARKLVTLSAAEAAPASQWRGLLFDAEIAGAVNALPDQERPPESAITPRPSGGGRPPKAQHHLERALADLASGRLPDAIAHVRIAASMAPRDDLIRQLLDRLAP